MYDYQYRIKKQYKTILEGRGVVKFNIKEKKSLFWTDNFQKEYLSVGCYQHILIKFLKIEFFGQAIFKKTLIIEHCTC